MKIADRFTLSRILLSPVFFVLYFIPQWLGEGFADGFSAGGLSAVSVYIMIPLLAFMEFTDFLDGYYARKHNEVSDFGKLFDPFGDVLVHLTIFFCFVLSGYMPGILFVLILYREFSMLFFRLMAIREGVAVGARKGGKAKTVLYVVAGLYSLAIESLQRLALILPETVVFMTRIGYILYILAFLASYISFCDYLFYFRKNVFGNNAKKSEKK
ncbi:MAG: CDP-diacylglycerol--glycerol-3-phosphate 3-phosphatidyltransferase [Spirochaetaceae bacterium]|jgi:CDP-diacylglycerol--glycerol-3-phosphate 3-phosphatidyltransferase|nr:CDP-diacylglycerol--glycerol-3-phosphate 3-phosphatidyltransferase [Spirochaetaceae bacterium]